jgi:uncharacterized membrane protein (DUF2068 family)
LTIAIILVILGGIISFGVAWSESGMRGTALPNWYVFAAVAAAIADVIAGIGLWRWKRWAYYLYLGSTLVSMALGLLVTGSAMFAFSRIIPFAIVGYIIVPKWSWFD